MRAVHVGIGHDDDPAVAQLGDIETAFVLAVAILFRFADAGADGRDHRLDFGVLEDLIVARFLDVDQFAANRQNRLVTPVASLLGGAAGRIAFDDVKLGQFRIALGTIGQFAGQTAAGERAFADCFAGFARRFARARRGQHLVENPFRDRRVLIEIGHQPVVDDRVHDPVDLGVDELHLGLRFEARIGQLDAEHADQPFAHIVAGNRRVLLFEKVVRLRVLVDGLRQRGAEAGQMRAAVRIRNRIGKRQNLVVVAVVVLQHDIDEDFIALPRDHDRLRMNHLFVLAELLYEFLDAVFVEKPLFLRRVGALVRERDLEAGIEKRQFAQPGCQTLELELGRDREDRRIGKERDQRAGCLFVFDFADDAEFVRRLALARTPCDRPCRRATLPP